ncbi:MAG: hypothetical protein FWE67_00285 [Planctomycetaceae bacterium]|nr:hypothetical protein [Planctomycetaceae bacterium]
MPKNKPKTQARWHASHESDELVFAICDRYFMRLGMSSSQPLDGETKSKGAAAAVAEWVQNERNRPDITREKIYPLFWEACRRGFLHLQPPFEKGLTNSITKKYKLEKHPGEITVVNAIGEFAARHVTSTAADLVVSLIDRVWKTKKKKHPNDPDLQTVHLGMGAGYAAMLVAKRLAQKMQAGDDVPPLVLHAISSGGFLPNEPHKAPSTYFTNFDPSLTSIKYVALFSSTVVNQEDYDNLRKNPGVRYSFEKKNEIDIVVTSLADAHHKHGLLAQYLTHLVEQGYLAKDLLNKMYDAGWVGDVQFCPYSEKGPLTDICPVRAVTLFELDEFVKMAKEPNDKYVVLVAGPCGECGTSKKDALKPLIANENLRLWTHLITDARTANELLE